MNVKEHYDIVVVGGGNTALLSALSAQETGAEVLVLEKAPKAQRGGNGCFTLGTYRATHKGIEEIRELIPDLTVEEVAMDIPPYTVDELYNEMMQVSDGMIAPELLEVITEESNKIIKWLAENLGVKWALSENSFRRIGGRLVYIKGRNVFQCKGAGYGLSEALYSLAEQRGIEVLYDTMATGLLVDSRGRVCSVNIRSGEELQNVKCKAVILACGGFEANAMWRAAFLGKDWDIVKVRGTKYNTGDGLKMALDIGAQPFGNWSGCHAAPINDDPHPSDKEKFNRSMSHMSYNYGLMVNLDGKRFVDEGADLAFLTYAKYGQHILAQPGRITFEVFDAKCEELLDIFYAERNRIDANSIEELAERLGINQEALSDTVTQFNRSTEGSFDPSILDGLHTVGISPVKSNWAQKLDNPPFFAIPAICGITFTWGGLKINRQAQVLNTADEVIPGLYTAGEMVGGIFYNNYSGGTGQLTGAIFGRIAGANAAS